MTPQPSPASGDLPAAKSHLCVDRSLFQFLWITRSRARRRAPSRLSTEIEEATDQRPGVVPGPGRPRGGAGPGRPGVVPERPAVAPVADGLGCEAVSFVLVAVVAVGCGLAAYGVGPWLLRRIPEPALEEGDTKTPYKELAGTRAAAWCGGIAAVAGGLLGWRLGWSAPLAAWLVLATIGAVLCYIDLRTRFLPSAIIWPTYVGVTATRAPTSADASRAPTSPGEASTARASRSPAGTRRAAVPNG